MTMGLTVAVPRSDQAGFKSSRQSSKFKAQSSNVSYAAFQLKETERDVQALSFEV